MYDDVHPSERSLRARFSAHKMHCKHDSRVVSQPARDAFMAKFEREVDPDGILPPTARERRAAHARKAYFVKLQLLSAKARRREAKRKARERDVAQAEAEARARLRARRRVVRRPESS